MGTTVSNVEPMMAGRTPAKSSGKDTKTGIQDIAFSMLMNSGPQMGFQDKNSVYGLQATTASDKAISSKQEQSVTDAGREWQRYEKYAAEKQPRAMDVAEGREQPGRELTTAAETVKDAIREELGISEEELEKAMETLGLSTLDLLDNSKLTTLLVELTGSGDAMALLFNESCKRIFQTAGDARATQAAKWNVKEEQFGALLEQVQAAGKEAAAVDGSMNAPENTGEISEGNATGSNSVPQNVGETQPGNMPEETLSMAENDQGTATRNPGNQISQERIQETEIPVNQTPTEEGAQITVRDERTPQGVGENLQQQMAAEEEAQLVPADQGDQQTAEVLAEGEDSLEGEVPKGETQENRPVSVAAQRQAESNGSNRNGGNNNQGNFMQNFQTAATEVIAQGGRNSQSTVNVEMIVRQIAEAVRLNLNSNASSMELQLHPETLGKINMLVVLKNGVVTAQLAAQNEAVKAALEQHVAQLRESMDAAGLKVDAIEVAVETHGFDRSLDYNDSAEQNAQQQETQSRNARKNLNAAVLGDMVGDLTEEETLAAKLMLDHGNTMDVTA